MKGTKLMPMCGFSATVVNLLNAYQVEYKDVNSDAITVSFKILKTNISSLKDAFVVIWTTTPWTIPANRAIACGKDIDYSLIQIKESNNNFKYIKNKKFLIATDLVESFKKSINVKTIKELEKFIEAKISSISTSPEREDTILIENPF